MAEPRAEVRNAADAEQVKRAERKTVRREAIRAANIKAVMSTVEGRAFVWDLLERARVFESIWHPSAAIHYNAGRQDFGHELQALVLGVDEDSYDLMAREARGRAKREGIETDAQHTASATAGRQ